MNLIDTMIYTSTLCAFSLLLGEMSCANEGKREAWQDCAGVYHEVCAGDRDCEYEYYKACINE